MSDMLDLFSLLDSDFEDLCGRNFGRLTAVRPVRRLANAGVVWHCKCECGNSHDVRAASLKSGHTQSCGCLQKSRTAAATTTHGLSGIAEYAVWQQMLQRCNNPSNKDYPNYGALGVTVCAHWEASFLSFHQDMGPRPSSMHQIDRIDPYGNYELSNCRWALAREGRKRDR